jgi:hypothetical protein
MTGGYGVSLYIHWPRGGAAHKLFNMTKNNSVSG